jgi:hypothetical protein
MAVPPSGPQKTFLNACLKLCRRAAGASTMLPSLVVSALFILLTLVLAHGARRLLDRIVKDSFMRLLLQEAVAAAELCACCFELIIGRTHVNIPDVNYAIAVLDSRMMSHQTRVISNIYYCIGN